MAEHLEVVTPLTVDIIAKFVIQPISCDWIGCTATVNSWFTLEKHLQLHCHHTADGGHHSKDDVLMTCQFTGCSNPKHCSLAMLKEHVKDDHLGEIPVPCPALGKFIIFIIYFFILHMICRLPLHCTCISGAYFSLLRATPGTASHQSSQCPF
ncbi:hypothetical protein BGW80DRAFT_800848 [Lactifluus volemus]|nr:hypothetical protein BGW80DRAFT_800848 [Lactifluus volemus]